MRETNRYKHNCLDYNVQRVNVKVHLSVWCEQMDGCNDGLSNTALCQARLTSDYLTDVICIEFIIFPMNLNMYIVMTT